ARVDLEELLGGMLGRDGAENVVEGERDPDDDGGLGPDRGVHVLRDARRVVALVELEARPEFPRGLLAARDAELQEAVGAHRCGRDEDDRLAGALAGGTGRTGGGAAGGQQKGQCGGGDEGFAHGSVGPCSRNMGRPYQTSRKTGHHVPWSSTVRRDRVLPTEEDDDGSAIDRDGARA